MKENARLLKFKLTTQVQIALISMFVLILVTDATSILSLRTQRRLSAQVEVQNQKRALAQTIQQSLEMQANGVRGFMLGSSETIRARDDMGRQQFASALQELKTIANSDAERRSIANLESFYQPYRTGCDQLVQLTRDGKASDAVTILTSTEFGQSQANVLQSLTDLDQNAAQQKQEALTELAASQNKGETLILILLVAALGFSVLVSWSVSGTLRAKTQALCAMIEKMATGHLNMPDAEVTGSDELSKALELLNAMKNNFQSLLQSISMGAQQIANVTNQIVAAASAQAQSAESQRNQTLQVASAMVEMSASLNEVAQNTSAVARVSEEATGIAGEGGDVVSYALASMRTIAESVTSTSVKVGNLGQDSQRIGQIAQVIDEIANQTNLLALNAAIEAARAGEAGRGFAVVAGEVRRLAERTGQATREITEMISTIRNGTEAAVAAMVDGKLHVEQGVETTEKAGESLSKIITTVGEVGHMVAQIAAATTEQAAATGEVQTNIEEISTLTQMSADAALATEKQCATLNEFSAALMFSVEQFQI
jgi:methyl-accepting chemotaxis protein